MSIKTYSHLHPSDHGLTFDLKRMEDIYALREGKTDSPHRHAYYTVILVEKGNGSHLIDFHEFALRGHQVFFIAPGQVHQLIEKEKSTGFVITFSRHFLAENNIRESFISDINLFQDYGLSPPLELELTQEKELRVLLENMETALQLSSDFRYEAVGAYLKLFLIQCHQACSLTRQAHPQQLEAGQTILRNFKALVEKHIRENHQVSFYASELSVTPDHLNKTVKSLIGKTAKEYLQSSLITEAKRMLIHSSQSAKEIAYQLGFQDPAYFSKFFKNCTDMSVSAFKAQYLG